MAGLFYFFCCIVDGVTFIKNRVTDHVTHWTSFLAKIQHRGSMSQQQKEEFWKKKRGVCLKSNDGFCVISPITARCNQ